MPYDPTLPTARDRVRLRVGDVTNAALLMPDSTYDALLAWHGNDEVKALRNAAQALITMYSQKPTEVAVAGSVSVKWAERIAQWQAIVAEVDRLTGVAGATIHHPRRATVAPEYVDTRTRAYP